MKETLMAVKTNRSATVKLPKDTAVGENKKNCIK